MSSKQWWPLIRRSSTVLFFLLFLIPIALLAGIRTWIFAVAFACISGITFARSVYVPARSRNRMQNAAKVLLTAAVILTIVHFSGLLDPFYTREGWLMLDLDLKVAPQQVHPGDSITYTLLTTNTGENPARGRGFEIDEAAYTGVLMYGVFPDLDSTYFVIAEDPSVSISSGRDSLEPRGKVCSVIYADPDDLGLNPMYWAWSTTYRPGWKVIGAITSDGGKHRNLGVGETFVLRYQVTVPLEHPEGIIHHRHASLSYRDPQWGTWIVHDLWFDFDDLIPVLPHIHEDTEDGTGSK